MNLATQDTSQKDIECPLISEILECGETLTLPQLQEPQV